MQAQKRKGAVMKMPDCPVVFYLPQPALPLSVYADLTNQTERAVQMQANTGKLVLTKEKPGKERRVNMVYEFLTAYFEAMEAMKGKS
ncbi:hypothetical protein [Serratia ureilytica]|uniref:hypothetical protein n=1 Tax=Serratia ureilytica TaxID=300181 RepID=UPI00371F094F